MQIVLYLSATNFNPKDFDQMSAVNYSVHHKFGLIIVHRKQKHKSSVMIFQFSWAFFVPWTIKPHFELTNNPKTKALFGFWCKHSKPAEKHINSSIYLYRAHAPTLPSLYCVHTYPHIQSCLQTWKAEKQTQIVPHLSACHSSFSANQTCY